MNLKRILWCLGVCLSLVACQKETSTLVPDTNWADVTLEEKGVSQVHQEKTLSDTVSRVESYREAKMNLYQKLETDILNLKIDVKRDVRTFIGNNQKLRDKVSAFLKNTRVTDAVYTPGKGMELTGQLYLGEGFKSILGLMEKKVPEEKSNSRPQTGSPPGKVF